MPRTRRVAEDKEIFSATVGSGNVFADLGIPEADEHQAKVQLAVALNRVIAKLDMPQAELAEKLGTEQPKISQIKNYKLGGFSSDRLMAFITALDCDIDIVIKQKNGHHPGRIIVRAA